MTAAAPGRVSAIDIFDPMCPAVLRNPYEAYRALRDRCPVAFLEPLDVWVVSRYAEVQSLLGAPEGFSAALAFGKDSSITDSRGPVRRQLNLKFAGDAGRVVSSTDGEAHARLRRTVARLLSKPRLDAADPQIRAHVQRVVAELAAAGSEFDVVEDLAKPVAAHAIGVVMGLDDDVVRVLAGWADLTSRVLDPGDDLSSAAAGRQVMRSNLASFRAVTAFLKAGARGAPSVPRNGMVESWREATTPAAREEVILAILQLFQAGYETIVSAVCHIMVTFVIDRPRPSDRPAGPELQADLIDEGFRLASPVRATFRTAVGARTVGGVSVPDGAMLMVLLGSANRDERVFDDPGTPRAGRRTVHLAFGGGPHRCLGRMLAQLETRYVLSALAAATRSISSVGGAKVSANVLKAGYEYLPVRAEWR
ncbi:cytochrome P450 [Actinacidiphila oryziradicis]|uniref:Cytochrome P450 n=1 Tax=Actinacidiphila oryziradicis TaxID=2571141 RepID=A0A4U0RZR7_9ACTN|nr:cytochrome P450 [Actinacidiphila oryziradicis]TKA00301.1 cytochrome P450 [Actinacidiphila oryziradicis]